MWWSLELNGNHYFETFVKLKYITLIRCHGEKDNAVFNLVKDHKVLDETTISYPNVSFVRSSGQTVDNESCGKLVGLCMHILESSKEELLNMKGSLGSYVVKKYQEALLTSEYKDVEKGLAYEVLDYFHKFENSIEASDTWFDTSANGYTHYWECEGHPLLNWRDKGYKTLFDFIMKKKPNAGDYLDVESKIQFKKEVTNISWSNSSHVTVKCTDGTCHDADHVICTMSLGVLKESHKQLFTPQLPQIKINAIEGLSFGTVDKIFLQFEKPFWRDDWAGFSLLWTQKDSEEIRKTTWAWLEDIFGFYKVDYQLNILCGWIGGPSARRMELLDDATILDGCMQLFKKFLGCSMPFTTPVKIIRSNWYSNSHFRGSYSFRSVTTDLLKTSASDLALPLYDCVGKPSLLFAGEATHDNYYSTVHGAIESGRREAERISSFYER